MLVTKNIVICTTRYFGLTKKCTTLSASVRRRKNPKKLWQLLKEVSTGSKEESKIEKMEVEGVKITQPTEIANHLKQLFFKHWKTNLGFSTAHRERSTGVYPMENPNVPHLFGCTDGVTNC
jgi:hypothetical protein